MEMPEGKYFIGDPCYAIDEWDDYLNEYLFVKGETSEGKGGENSIGTFKGRPVFAGGTAFGDGCYDGDDGNSYGVDSGTIGVTPYELCSKYTDSRLKRLGTIRTFKEPFDVFVEDGVFFIADLIIDTKGTEPDEEEE